jgi:hypothetical protein
MFTLLFRNLYIIHNGSPQIFIFACTKYFISGRSGDLQPPIRPYLCWLNKVSTFADYEHTISSMTVIRLKRIYNFWCSMLVFSLFALCFVTLRGIFMRFPELTYWQDATVPVSYFLLFLCFRNATQEIFSELDETSSRSLIFPESFPKTKREPAEVQRPPSHVGGRGLAPGRAHLVWGAPGCPWRRPFAYKKPRDGKP